jgi:hypothetical protein
MEKKKRRKGKWKKGEGQEIDMFEWHTHHTQTHTHTHTHAHTHTRTHTQARFSLIFHGFSLFLFLPLTHQNTHDHTTEQTEIQTEGGQVRKRFLLQPYSRAYIARFFLSSASSLLFFCVHASAPPWLENSSSKLISAPFLLNRCNLCVGCAYINICHDIHTQIYAHQHFHVNTMVCSSMVCESSYKRKIVSSPPHSRN